MHKLEQNY